jgi:transketolase
MITTAAALAAQSFEVWVYSIAPFVYARPLEQIRNDICFHHLPVRLIGNGGGYGYGVMGPTHHAIDDYGILLTLPGMAVAVPAFDQDIADVVDWIAALDGPCYLRLGRGEAPTGWVPPAFEPWRQLTSGGGPVVVSIGPLAGTYIAAFEAQPEPVRPNLWLIGALPIETHPVPDLLLSQLERSPGLCVAEEHVAQGSVASQLLMHLARRGTSVRCFRHLYATAHNFGTYGSQQFMRTKSGLDHSAMMQALESM